MYRVINCPIPTTRQPCKKKPKDLFPEKISPEEQPLKKMASSTAGCTNNYENRQARSTARLKGSQTRSPGTVSTHMCGNCSQSQIHNILPLQQSQIYSQTLKLSGLRQLVDEVERLAITQAQFKNIRATYYFISERLKISMRLLELACTERGASPGARRFSGRSPIRC